MIKKVYAWFSDLYYNYMLSNQITLVLLSIIVTFSLIVSLIISNLLLTILLFILEILIVISFIIKHNKRHNTKLKWFEDLPEVHLFDIYKKHYIDEGDICIQYRIRSVEYYDEPTMYIVEGLNSSGKWYQVSAMSYKSINNITRKYSSTTQFYRVALYLYNWYITAIPIKDLYKQKDSLITHQGKNKNIKQKALPAPQYAEHAAVENVKDPDDWADY